MNFTKSNYTDNEGSSQFKIADGSSSATTTTSTFQKNHGQTTAVSLLRYTRSDRPNDFLTDKMAVISSYADKISQNITQIHIYGDTEITVGDMIKCTFPSTKDTDDNTGKSRLDSGNYLVSKLCHIILNTDRPQHTIALELIKGGFTEN